MHIPQQQRDQLNDYINSNAFNMYMRALDFDMNIEP